MPQYGRYNPVNAENTSSLFSYQEVPLRSSKLNVWNGNLAAAFELLHLACSKLLAQEENGILAVQGETPLLVKAQPTPGLTVQVESGWAVVAKTVAGLKERVTLPRGGLVNVPTAHPRIDLLVIDATGDVRIIEGSEAAAPQVPATPDEAYALAELYARPGMTAIKDQDDGVEGYLIDKRQRFWVGDFHQHAVDRAPSETPDGLRTLFSTAHLYRPGTLDVYLNGVLQENGVDYQENPDAAGYTFFNPPPSHSRIQHRYEIQTYASS
jgi:hypothetical protein